MRLRSNLATLPQPDDDIKEIRVLDAEIRPVAFVADRPQRHYFLAFLSLLQVAAIGVLTWYVLFINAQTTQQMVELRKSVELLSYEVSSLQSVIETPHEETIIFLKILHLRPQIEQDLAKEIARCICKYSRQFEKDSDLILAIIQSESRFDPHAISSMGARGLMQIMPAWIEVYGIKESLFDVETNIKHGTMVLATYDAMYKNKRTALAAYNRGPGAVDWELSKTRKVVSEYADNVLKTYHKLRKLNMG